MFYVWPTGHYLPMFTYATMLYSSVRYKWVTCVCICSLLLAKNIFVLVYSWFAYTRCVHQQVWHLEWFWDFISPILVYFLYTFCKVTTSILLLVKIWTILHFCILFRFHHLYMPINNLLTGLGRRFPDISNLEIISCEPFITSIYFT